MRAKKPTASQPLFTFIDLFAGIGGLRLGVEAAGGKCIFTSEWNEHCQKTYRANFPDDDHDIVGDITKFDLAAIPKHNLLVAGFPCQPFSIAGVSKKNALGRPHGFRCEEQGNLFFTIRDILRLHRPEAFLLENVKNLKSHDGGTTYAVIRQELGDLGYEFDSVVLNAKGLVPQNRERIFIVGFREPVGFTFDGLRLPAPDRGPKLGDYVLHGSDPSEKPDGRYTFPPKLSVHPRYNLTPHLWQYLRQYAEKHRAAGHGFGYGKVGPKDVSRTLSARYYKDGSEILVDRGGRKTPRRLTPRECARLMGFDQKGKPPFIIPEDVSDTQAYKQFGNAVVVPVVRIVADYLVRNFLRPYIEGRKPASLWRAS